MNKQTFKHPASGQEVTTSDPATARRLLAAGYVRVEKPVTIRKTEAEK